MKREGHCNDDPLTRLAEAFDELVSLDAPRRRAPLPGLLKEAARARSHSGSRRQQPPTRDEQPLLHQALDAGRDVEEPDGMLRDRARQEARRRFRVRSAGHPHSAGSSASERLPIMTYAPHRSRALTGPGSGSEYSSPGSNTGMGNEATLPSVPLSAHRQCDRRQRPWMSLRARLRRGARRKRGRCRWKARSVPARDPAADPAGSALRARMLATVRVEPSAGRSGSDPLPRGCFALAASCGPAACIRRALCDPPAGGRAGFGRAEDGRDGHCRRPAP